MKSIYTMINNTLYRIRQDASVPYQLSTLPAGCTAALSMDTSAKEVTEIIKINTLKRSSIKSNGQLVQEMLDKLKEDKITEIDTIQNNFKIYIDYSVYCEGRLIDHSAVIRSAIPHDKGIFLGVSRENELLYRRVKYFEHDIEFAVKNPLPFGITHTRRQNYEIKVNAVCLFEDIHGNDNYHPSHECVPLQIPSASIDTTVSDMLMVYSSENDDVDISPIQLAYIPRKMCFKIQIQLADYYEVYSKATVDAILLENIKNKYDHIDPTVPDKPDNPDKPDVPDKPDNPDKPDEPDKPDTPITPSDNPKPADGDFDPDDNGWFDFYERCTSTSPGRLLVVEDAIPAASYSSKTMIRKSNVIKDIPDIKVGEYVLYRESFTSDPIKKKADDEEDYDVNIMG